MDERNSNNLTPMHPWSASGGPRTVEHRNMAKRWFLEELPRCHTVTFACEYAGIAPFTAYKWKEQDKKFADAWDRAVERTHDIARAKIFERAFDGVDTFITSNGRQVCDTDGKPLIEKKYSDSLAALYARANLPEYKEKQQIDLHVKLVEEAEKAKEALLASLGAAVDEDSKATPQG